MTTHYLVAEISGRDIIAIDSSHSTEFKAEERILELTDAVELQELRVEIVEKRLWKYEELDPKPTYKGPTRHPDRRDYKPEDFDDAMELYEFKRQVAHSAQIALTKEWEERWYKEYLKIFEEDPRLGRPDIYGSDEMFASSGHIERSYWEIIPVKFQG